MTVSHIHDELSWDIHDRLYKALRVANMKPGEMALALGIHRNTVGNYLAGRTPVDRRTLVAWATLTKVPLEWLEFGISIVPDGPNDGMASRHARTGVWFERPQLALVAA